MKFKLLLEKSIENLTPQTDTIRDYEEFEDTLTAIYELDYKRTMIRFDDESSEEWTKHVYGEYSDLLEQHLDILLAFWWKVFMSWEAGHLESYLAVLYNEYDSDSSGILTPLKSASRGLIDSLDTWGGFITNVIGDGTSLQNVYADIRVLDDIIDHLDTFVSQDLYYEGTDLITNSIEDLEDHYDIDDLKSTAANYSLETLKEAIGNLYSSTTQLYTDYYNILDGDFREAMEKYQKYTDEELQEELKNLSEMGEDTQPLQKLIAVSDELNVNISEIEGELHLIEEIFYEEQFDTNLENNPPLYVLSALNDDLPRFDSSSWLKNLEHIGVTPEEIFDRMGEFFGYMDNIKSTLGLDVNSKIQLANVLKQKFHRTGSILEYVQKLLDGGGFENRMSAGAHTDVFKLFSLLSMDSLEDMLDKVSSSDDYDFDKADSARGHLEELYAEMSNKQLKLLAQWNKDLRRDGLNVPKEMSRKEMERIKQAREVE